MAGENTMHLALLPWLAFGHLIPFLHLAIALAAAGLRISYLSTSGNIRRLPAGAIPPHLSSLIRFIPLTLATLDGLPEHIQSTIDVATAEQGELLALAYDRLYDQVKTFMAGVDRPDFLIYDVMAHWAPNAASEAGSVRGVSFCIFPASSMAFLGWPPEGADTEDDDCVRRWWPSPESLTSPPEWTDFPAKIAFRRWEAEAVYGAFLGKPNSGLRAGTRYVRSVKGSEDAVIYRCSREYSAESFDVLSKLIGKPAIPVGWLPPTVLPTLRDTTDGRHETLEWLDGREPESVVFVSFGSEYKMSRAEVCELAHGLELSDVSFVWVLQRPAWLGGDEENENALPDGFRSRMQGRGMVSFGWAPQQRILAHEAVGGTLFHVGWSSVIESVSLGLVLVLLPGVLDQGLIARRLVEKGLGVEVERDEDDGSFDRNGVVVALRRAMASEETERLSEKAREMSVLLGDQGIHDKYIGELVYFLQKSRRN